MRSFIRNILISALHFSSFTWDGACPAQWNMARQTSTLRTRDTVLASSSHNTMTDFAQRSLDFARRYPNPGRKGDFSDCGAILRELHKHHDGKFGYVIYRITYDNNEEWEHFMERLWEFAAAALEFALRGHEVEDRFEWDVRDDAAVLSGATKSEVRRLFMDWVDSVDGHRGMPRYRHCIYADQEVVDAVLSGEPPWTENPDDVFHPRAFVKIVDSLHEDHLRQDAEHETDSEQRAKMNAGDEGYPDLEGCKRRDVGWYKQSARFLVPRAYHLLMNDGWYQAYRRPPAIGSD
ncbi:hypothetical protein HII31_08120 [Pseudocercospora fuligena]|uniref:Uncharacterized protein n=1 Tax=Pseudocercospora fuligena TaxID=685502 RepID=A0A8H6RH36_9PEZI|nr:hypothetical protein HII31_08120 [Pseudocercospora fuligena]